MGRGREWDLEAPAFSSIDQNKRNRILWKARCPPGPGPHRPSVDDEEGFGRRVEATVCQGLAVAQGEVASFVVWVLRGAEVEPHGGCGSGLHILEFLELIWGERTEPGASRGLELGETRGEALAQPGVHDLLPPGLRFDTCRVFPSRLPEKWP